MMLDQDIYSDALFTLPLLVKGSIITADYLQRLRDRDIRTVYVKEESAITRGNRSNIIYVPEVRATISPKLRAEAVACLEQLFKAIGEGNVHTSVQIIKNLDNIVDQLVSSIGRDRFALININDLRSYDEYTYHHSLSVAVLSIAIGQHLGLDRNDLHHLGKCAMMHDIGKVEVPIEILHKPTRLSNDEFNVVRHHSASGFNFLVNQNIGDDKLRSGVLYHHEKVNGKGYPHGLTGNLIPLWGRIISVGDVYDALTSNRPYRRPMLPSEAIEYIMGGIGSNFDYDIVKAFAQRVALYPVGSFVELSNGHTAVVLNTQSGLRPVVRILETGAVADLRSDMKYLSTVITRPLSKQEVIIRRA